MIVDTHCHIYKEYYDDIDEVVRNAKENNVGCLINNACNFSSSKEVLELCKNYENMYCVLGLHPNENLSELSEVITLIEENLSNNKMLGIGEIGLDYSYTKENKEEQIKVFESQLKLAEKYNLPVILHSREATEDTLRILKKYKLKGIIHCFNGSVEIAKEYLKLGFKLGVNGVATFKNCKLIETLKKIGIDNIVFETDSPYLTPVPYRGKKNEPIYVVNVLNFVAENLGLEKDYLVKGSNNNISEIFDINFNS